MGAVAYVCKKGVIPNERTGVVLSITDDAEAATGPRYGVTVKDLLRRGAPALLTQLVGAPVAEFLPAEFPAVRNIEGRIRAIVRRIAALEESACRDALIRLVILGALRGAVEQIKQEVEAMPITIHVTDDPYLFKLYNQVKDEGRNEGRMESAADILMRQLTRRFGEVPEAVTARVRAATLGELEGWLDRVIDAPELEAVFGTPRPS
jgi:DNA-binding FrmR family transcriptional regulator